jgi:YHS domain-containing protein
MEWLSQNWLWVLLMIGVVVMMRRGGMGCGFMGGRPSRDGRPTSDHEHPPHTEATGTLDPVSGSPVNPEGAVSSGYQGRLYYFASRENRDLFEQSPQRYAAAGASADADPQAHRHHRHGC